MKKVFAIILALVMVLSLAACGGTEVAPETSAETTEAAAGSYTYQEDKGNFKIDWTLTLNEDGTYVLMEHNGLVDVDVEHKGASYEQDGDLVKLGAWDDPSADKSDFFLDDGSSQWKLDGDKMTPVIDESQKSIAGTYSYSEDRGDFKIEWKIVLNKGGDFVLEETHGLSGNVTNHTGKEWKDNGDGTFTTGAWDTDDNKSEFFRPNGEADWKIVDAENKIVEPVADENAKKEDAGVNPGKYIFVDGNDTWEVLIMGNGNCRLDLYATDTYGQEGVEAVASIETVDGWKDNGDGTFETGEWPPFAREGAMPRMAAPNGCVNWKITGEGDPVPCEPTEKAKDDGGQGDQGVQYGAYYWTDEANDALYAVLIMGNGNCVIQERDKADREKQIEGKEYKTKGFRINDDGTFTNFAFDDGVEAPAFITGNGMCTWKIVDQDNWGVELVEQITD